MKEEGRLKGLKKTKMSWMILPTEIWAHILNSPHKNIRAVIKTSKALRDLVFNQEYRKYQLNHSEDKETTLDEFLKLSHRTSDGFFSHTLFQKSIRGHYTLREAGEIIQTPVSDLQMPSYLAEEFKINTFLSKKLSGYLKVPSTNEETNLLLDPFLIFLIMELRLMPSNFLIYPEIKRILNENKHFKDLFPKEQKRFFLQLKRENNIFEKLSTIQPARLIGLMTWNSSHILKLLEKLSSECINSIPIIFFTARLRASFFDHTLKTLDQNHVEFFLKICNSEGIILPIDKEAEFYWSFFTQPVCVLLDFLIKNGCGVKSFIESFFGEEQGQFFSCWETISSDNLQIRMLEPQECIDNGKDSFLNFLERAFKVLVNYSEYLFTQKGCSYPLNTKNNNPGALKLIKDTRILYQQITSQWEYKLTQQELLACFSFSNCHDALNRSAGITGQLLAFIKTLIRDINRMDEDEVPEWFLDWDRVFEERRKFYNYCFNNFDLHIYKKLSKDTQDSKLIFLYLAGMLTLDPSEGPRKVLDDLRAVEEFLKFSLENLEKNLTEMENKGETHAFSFCFFNQNKKYRKVEIKLNILEGIKELLDTVYERKNLHISFTS